MRLIYDKSIPSTALPLVLCGQDGVRVEIHLRKDDGGAVTLLAFAGRNPVPQRSIQQGPYETLAQAIAARRAIATQLMGAGYQLEESDNPIWSMAAQRSVKALREQKASSQASYRFDPKDVFLDW